MSPRRNNAAAARARAGQALAALGLSQAERRTWLDAHAHLDPRALLRALTEEFAAGDPNFWRNLPDGQQTRSRNFVLSVEASAALAGLMEEFEFPLDETLLDTVLDISEQLGRPDEELLRREIRSFPAVARESLSRAIAAALRKA